MEKKMLKKLVALIAVITILSTDFFMLGTSLLTYATHVTNEIEGYPNIHFSTYFKDGENETKEITKSIKEKNIKIYAKIGINSDVDYLENVQIKLVNNNFNILSSNKGTLDGNTVKLDYIAAGSSTEIELNIEPIFEDKIASDMILKPRIEMSANYKNAEAPEGEEITATSELNIKYQPDESTEAELTADIITNKVLTINGKNQRVIQALIKSRLTNNDYPVKQTILNVNIPNLGETEPEVRILTVGKSATNGLTEISNKVIENGQLQITINNEIDENNQISWNKNAYDELIITYIYPETADANKVEITANSEIKLHSSGNTYTAKYTKGIENQELDNTILERTEAITTELYKGQLYANVDTQYDTKTSIIATIVDTEKEISVQENSDVFETDTSEIKANTKYLTTKINLENMLYILGQEGKIEIKNGQTVININKDSSVDQDGNVIINYENSESEITITTSKPVNAGVLEIYHTKAIIANSYTREDIRSFNKLKTVGENQTSIELKETVTEAQLTIDRTSLSATESNEVMLGIKLLTDSVKYDLYKNPTITIKFPDAVENVEFVDEPNKIYADEFSIISKNYDSSNHTLKINMSGEQTKYPESSLTQSYIQLKLKITLSQYSMSQTDKITMTYTNENATQYVNGTEYGIAEKTIEISAPNELVKIFNINSNENTSLTEKVLQQVKPGDAGKEFDFNVTLINNKDTDISNIKILGKLPSTENTITGENKNTLNSMLKKIATQNATIYYTENVNANTNIDDSTNGWTTNINSNAKLYLIKIDKLTKGEKFTAQITIQMPDVITENAISYSQYEVIYDTDTENEVKESSRKIGLMSSLVAGINVETTAQVGNDILENDDRVKEGEVIKYTVTVSNSGTEKLENVKVKLDIPEGTVLVKPIEKYIFDEGTDGETVIENGGFVYAEGKYYEEITDNEELAKLTNITIQELPQNGTYTTEYEVRINKGTANKEISNKIDITYNESSIESKEIKNFVEESNIRVTIKRAVDISEQLYPNGYGEFIVYVENLSDSKIENIELQILSEGFKTETVTKLSEDANTNNKIEISEIEAKEIITYAVYGKIDSNINEMKIWAIVKDSAKEIYRSNLVKETLPKVDASVSITSPQAGGVIQEGDTVEYNITVKNTGDIESIIQVSDIISEYLKVESIYVNKELIESSNTNNINYPIVLKPQEQATIDIKAKVGYIPELYHGKIITNNVTIKVADVIERKSETITHVIKSSEMIDDDLNNIISGFVWFDTNLNGNKDNEEETLSGISIKLFNKTTQQYVTDEYGNPIEVLTGENGEYVFTNIAEGSYIMIFKYNDKEYKFEINNLSENMLDINVGLNEKLEVEIPNEPNNPENPEDSENPSDSEKPGTSEEPDEEKLQTINGVAWLDDNRNGQKEDTETLLSGIKAKLYDIATKKIIAEATTNENGKYEFSNVENGKYIIIFEYDTEEYEPTIYMAEGIDTAENSKAILNNINIEGKEILAAVTDIIEVQENNISNMNIGLKENLIFDLELNKYISKIIVQTSEKTKQYDYENDTFAKVEIHRKQIQGANVVLEYTIKVKNNGEIAGYAKNIVDYLPSGLTFSSELNKDWYISGNYLYTKNLENTKIQPGEEKEVKLILTKTMTSENVGLVNNRAEIYQDYNQYGEADVDSIPNNQSINEDDFGSVDVIIQIATGGSNTAYVILLIINMVLIGFAIELMIKKRIIKIPSKKWRM